MENVCRLDQLANYADGLCACVEMDAFFSLFLCEGTFIEDWSARNKWVTSFFTCGKNLEIFSVPSSFGFLSGFQVLFELSDEYPVNLPKTCYVVAQLLGVLGAQVVVVVQLVIHFQLFHHAHEDGAVGVEGGGGGGG